MAAPTGDGLWLFFVTVYSEKAKAHINNSFERLRREREQKEEEQ